jgi:hypothetical protein
MYWGLTDGFKMTFFQRPLFIKPPTNTHPLPAMQRAITPEEFFYHIFEPLPRQGPKCTGATRKAWSYLLPEDA